LESLRSNLAGFLAGFIESITMFIANALTTLAVFVDNWDLVVQAIKLGAKSAFIEAVEFAKKGFVAMLDIARVSVLGIIDLLSGLGKAVYRAIRGESFFGALQDELNTVVANAAQRLERTGARFRETTAEQRAAREAFMEPVRELSTKIAEATAERERQVQDEIAARRAAARDEATGKPMPAEIVKPIELDLKGFTGFDELNNRLQQMFLEEAGDDNQAKLVGLTEVGNDLQKKQLEATRDVVEAVEASKPKTANK
jgi:hypothetical protein